MSTHEHMVFAAAGRWVAALDARTGHVAWRTRVSGGRWFGGGIVTLALEAGTLVVGLDGRLTGLEPATGRVLWSAAPDGFGSKTVMLAGSSQAAAAGSIAAQQAAMAAATAASAGGAAAAGS